MPLCNTPSLSSTSFSSLLFTESILRTLSSKFTVMSLEGKIIKKESISKKSYKLNFSDKPDGIYIFLAESSNRKSVIRIIKKETN